jgi:putative FmdB family regulatory protein
MEKTKEEVAEMPTYDYLCSNCGHKFEAFQSMKDAPLDECPECGKKTLERLIGGGAGLIFKGSGFYITDYKSSGYKNEKKSKEKPAAATK